MSRYVKPIQPTPALSGKDAEAIINQVLKIPSKSKMRKLEKRYSACKDVFKE